MQYAYKLVIKSEPVKKSQPVERYLQIITLFSEGNKETGLGSNDIWRLTGRTDKQQVYSDIKSLLSATILSSQKKQTGYKDPKFLTKLGKGIRQFVADMDNFERAYEKLQETVNRHFNLEPQAIPIYLDDTLEKDLPYNIRTMPLTMRSKLRANGWSDEEMIDYANCHRFVHGLLLNRTIVVNAMMSRYFDIIVSNGLVVDNRNITGILNQILLKYIGKQLETATGSNNTKNINNDRKNLPPANGRPFRYNDGGIIFSGVWSVERYFEYLVMEGLLNNKYISMEVRELLGAILLVLRPRICHIESTIDYIKNSLTRKKENLLSLRSSERVNSLLVFYEDIIERLR